MGEGVCEGKRGESRVVATGAGLGGDGEGAERTGLDVEKGLNEYGRTARRSRLEGGRTWTKKCCRCVCVVLLPKLGPYEEVDGSVASMDCENGLGGYAEPEDDEG